MPKSRQGSFFNKMSPDGRSKIGSQSSFNRRAAHFEALVAINA